MKHSKITGHFNHGNNHIDVHLGLIFFEEEGKHFVYTPALDITGYGNSEDEAKNSFEETLKEFLRYTSNKDTLKKELKKLGWKVTPKVKIKAPSLVDMINNNEYLAEIFEEKQYRKVNQTVQLPAFV